MEKNDAFALRILSTALTVLLILANWKAAGPFWFTFILGAACGLSVGVSAIVWRKQLHWVDHKIYPIPASLNLSDAGRER
ncbi:MAG: hypothetical protein ACR2NN_25405 [Bryobacteraceae bacterium]